MEPSTKRKWSGVVVPALVLALLGVQFALGFQGFGKAEGWLGLVGAPGALLGWGGAVILAILLSWLIAGWVGRDLFGLQGAGGFAVRLIGCVALGVAIAGLCGLAGGPSVGGKVGSWLADILRESFGSDLLAAFVLVVMAIPAFVLSISPFFFTGPVRRPDGGVPKDQLVELDPKPGLYQGATPSVSPLYPERRYDENGVEIPMSFDGHDVGSIRYLGDETEDGAEERPGRRPDTIRPEPVDVEAEIRSLPSGVRWADDEGEGVDDGPEGLVETRDDRIPLPPGVHYVGEDEEDEGEDDVEEGADEDEGAAEDDDVEYEDEDEDEDEEEYEEEEDDEEGEEEEPEDDEEHEEYEDEDLEDEDAEEEEDLEDEVEEEEDEDEDDEDVEEEDEEEELDEGDEGDEEELDEGDEEGELEVEVGEEELAPEAPIPPPEVDGAAALEALKDERSGALYRAKLEGSGIFDEAPTPPRPAPEPPPPPARKTPARKKAAPAKKKAVAPKKPTTRKATAKKGPPKKKAATSRKAAPKAASKGAAPKKAGGTKATAKKKAAKKKAAPKKAAAQGRKKAPGAPKKKVPPKAKAKPAKKAPAARTATPKAQAPKGAAPKAAARKGTRPKTALDETYRRAVDVAIERGAASSVLLSRRLGIGYAQARALIDVLVKDGILGEMTPSGSRPLRITEAEWKKRRS